MNVRHRCRWALGGVLAGALWVSPQEFRNVQVLAGIGTEEMSAVMDAANRSLGVECDFCHVDGEWHLDDKEPKQTAREMIAMLGELSVSDFEVLELPTCWTCHRGERVPPTAPPPGNSLSDARFDASAFVTDDRPSGQVYENLLQYGDLPASELGPVMESYSRALGADCSHCHVVGEWASDEKVTKRIARRMLEIQNRIGSDFLGSSDRVSCWTCHRGEVTPEMALPVP